MTDFTKQITAGMTPAQVAEVLVKDLDQRGLEVGVADDVIAAAIDAYVAARERGYTPGERMPPEGAGHPVWIQDDDGYTGLAYFDQGNWWSLGYGEADYISGKIVRWWHLPGGKR